MMASDASRNMERAVELIPPVYVLPIQFIAVFVLLCNLLSWSMLTVVVATIFFMPINIFIFMNIAKITSSIASFTDARVKLINELLSGIRVVKFYGETHFVHTREVFLEILTLVISHSGWEIPFRDRIQEARKNELKWIQKHAYWMSIGLTTMFTQIPSLLQMGALITYFMIGGDFTPTIIFVALPYFQQLQQVRFRWFIFNC